MAEIQVRSWLTSDEASKYVGRSALTIRDWSIAGIVRRRKRRGEWEYASDSLLQAKRIMESNYRRRHIVPGPGRGRWFSEGQGELW